MWDYTDKVRDHFLHPRNVGEIENPDGFGEIGNITCGDALRLTFKLDEKGRVENIKFKTFGCGSAIASASVLTEMCKGKTLDEIKKISNKDIAAALDGLPREKMHCSVMGQEALEAAIAYYESGGEKSAPAVKHGRVVCTCFNVTESEIEQAIRENGLTTVEDVTNFTKAGGGCGGCHAEIEKIISRVNGTSTAGGSVSANSAPLTTLQKVDRIREVIEREIRPILKADGGDCELVDFEGNCATIAFKGHCAGCAFSSMTLVSVVEKKLRENISRDLTVKPA